VHTTTDDHGGSDHHDMCGLCAQHERSHHDHRSDDINEHHNNTDTYDVAIYVHDGTPVIDLPADIDPAALHVLHLGASYHLTADDPA
jgi:hypothetical protein